MRRREFLLGLAVLPLAYRLPVDDYPGYSPEFFARVYTQAQRIAEREGRPIHKIWIDPPVDGYRFVRLHLVSGMSIMERVAFNWSAKY